MRLLITDVTEMHRGNYCVAGWCAAQNRMVRPMLNGSSWTAPILAAYGITPGATIDVQPTGVSGNGTFPHRTEDTPIKLAGIDLVSPGPADWFGRAAPPATETLAEAFHDHVQHNSIWDGCRQGVHVPAGVKARSLWAITVRRERLTFVEDFAKLKAVLDDGTASYKLAVSTRELKEAWRDSGMAAVNQALPRTAVLHVRVGLARAFGNPADKCYMMINGVYG
jgi:hypothetical protein